MNCQFRLKNLWQHKSGLILDTDYLFNAKTILFREMYGLLLHHLNTFLKALVFQLKMSPQWHYLDSCYDFYEIQHGSDEGAFLFRKICIKHVRTIQQQERQDIGAICQVSGNVGLFDKWLTQMVDLRWHNI